MTATASSEQLTPHLEADTAAHNKRPAERRGRKKLTVSSPVQAQAALMAFAGTGSQRHAARLTGICATTVAKLIAEHPDRLIDARKKLAEAALVGSAICLDRVFKTPHKLSGLPAIIGAKTLGQMALEQLDKSPAAVIVNVQLLNQTMLDSDRLSHEVQEMERRLSTGDTLPVVVEASNNE